jgi:competence protein ComEA
MKTDINTATIEQLETVNGVGQDTAQNILDYKKEHGKFQTMEELEGVKGVGKVRSQALSEAFTVESTKKSH